MNEEQRYDQAAGMRIIPFLRGDLIPDSPASGGSPLVPMLEVAHFREPFFPDLDLELLGRFLTDDDQTRAAGKYLAALGGSDASPSLLSTPGFALPIHPSRVVTGGVYPPGTTCFCTWPADVLTALATEAVPGPKMSGRHLMRESRNVG